jgi:hypothetical protein
MAARRTGRVSAMEPEQHDPDRIRDPLEDLEPDADPESPGLDDDFAEAADEGADPAPSG